MRGTDGGGDGGETICMIAVGFVHQPCYQEEASIRGSFPCWSYRNVGLHWCHSTRRITPYGAFPHCRWTTGGAVVAGVGFVGRLGRWGYVCPNVSDFCA